MTMPQLAVDTEHAKLLASIKAAMTHAQARGYLQGFRRAVDVIALAIGQLDGESRERIAACMDQLEDELAEAEKNMQ